ncbi:MAG: hypothetical protein GY800_13855 [Planctomycetes bacterium]|nr:hypothetical protein [Planctomycetota bacterium]
MYRTTFLVLFMLFTTCVTGMADVITAWDGSVFEGEVVKTKRGWLMLKVPEGTVGMPDDAVVTIEEREPTADESASLVKFKTEDYNVTLQADSVTPFEEELVVESNAILDENPDLPDEAITVMLSQNHGLPTLIVDMILFKAFSMSQ